MKLSNYFMLALVVLFFALGFQALQEAQPEAKNEKVYQALKPYMPYYLEKRVGGFQIMMKGSNEKEKPPITDVFKRLEQLEKGWGQQHLKIVGDDLIVMDANKTQIGKVSIKLADEKMWVKTFFMIQ